MLSIFSYHVKHANELLVNLKGNFKISPILFDENELLFHIEVYFGEKKLVKKLYREEYSFVIKETLFKEDGSSNDKRRIIVPPEDRTELIHTDLIDNFLYLKMINEVLTDENQYILKEMTQYEIKNKLINININTSLFLTNLMHYQIKGIHYLVYQFGEYYSIIKAIYNKNGELKLPSLINESVRNPVYTKFNVLATDIDSFSEFALRVVSEFDLEDLSEAILMDGNYMPIFAV